MSIPTISVLKRAAVSRCRPSAGRSRLTRVVTVRLPFPPRRDLIWNRPIELRVQAGRRTGTKALRAGCTRQIQWTLLGGRNVAFILILLGYRHRRGNHG